ncbi:MAG: VOC family protein [Spirochaetales bacterium]|nr:VOC family protein [Spirochaetales bacterium]
MKYIRALFTVADIQSVRQFYENILGQKIKYDFGLKVVYHGYFVIQLADDFRKLMPVDDFQIIRNPNNAELYFETDDFDRIHENLLKENVRFIHAPVEQPWKQRVMRIFDPNLNIIEIGETVEIVIMRLHSSNYSFEEICLQTQMAPDFIAWIIARKK